MKSKLDENIPAMLMLLASPCRTVIFMSDILRSAENRQVHKMIVICAFSELTASVKERGVSSEDSSEWRVQVGDAQETMGIQRMGG